VEHDAAAPEAWSQRFPEPESVEAARLRIAQLLARGYGRDRRRAAVLRAWIKAQREAEDTARKERAAARKAGLPPDQWPARHRRLLPAAETQALLGQAYALLKRLWTTGAPFEAADAELLARLRAHLHAARPRRGP
jgi:hypothetical protein